MLNVWFSLQNESKVRFFWFGFFFFTPFAFCSFPFAPLFTLPWSQILMQDFNNSQNWGIKEVPFNILKYFSICWNNPKVLEGGCVEIWNNLFFYHVQISADCRIEMLDWSTARPAVRSSPSEAAFWGKGKSFCWEHSTSSICILARLGDRDPVCWVYGLNHSHGLGKLC